MTSATYSRTVTVTRAQVRRVMNAVEEELGGLVLKRLISQETLDSWVEALIELQVSVCVTLFEVQIRRNGLAVGGVRYEIRPDGVLQHSGPSGGINVWGLQDTDKVGVVVQRADALTAAQQAVFDRWVAGEPTSLIDLPGDQDRTYSYHGYGLARTRFGGL
ncbi:MAG TPA: hypothetical protein PKA64_06935 [Myxococcota bacterium]|nr:hypothetical protein [Myxococcota bacterium]